MRLLAIACAAIVPAVALGQVRIDEPFKSRVEVITITATVTDEHGRLVADLPREAFELYEDGDPRTITQFTHERVPVALGLALDVSDSMFGQRLVDARAAVERFLFELLAPEDEYFVLTFNHLPRLVTSWTTDPAVVRQRLVGLQASGGTAVYDAVVSALPQFARRHRQRAALVVISDGADTASDAAIRDVRAALLRSDAFVYAVAIDSPGTQPINTRVNPYALREVTDDSGGRTLVVRDTDGLREATQRIAEELNSQYLVGFVSAIPSDGEFHSLRLRVKDGRFTVRSRRGYVATPLTRPSPGDAPLP
jgi:VWFA-related protein